MSIDIHNEHWIFATGTPDLVEVYRAISLPREHPAVAEYITEHGLTLAGSTTFDDEFMYGEQAVLEVYTRPGTSVDTSDISESMFQRISGMSFVDALEMLIENGVEIG